MTAHPASMILIGLAVIVVSARLAGMAVRWLGQPAVIGEITVGILLGPTFVQGAIADTLFPGSAQAALSTVATCGLALFMFMMGWDLSLSSIKRDGRIALSVSIGSTVLPFALGVGLACLLIRNHSSEHPAAFILFMGVAMSISAFPVLARILTDRGMHRSHIGATALASAAVDDVVAWSMLAVVLTVAGSEGSRPWLSILLVPYVAVMIGLIRPLMRRLAMASGPAENGSAGFLAVVIAGILLSGAVTEQLGLHYVFGAFLFGAIMPRVGEQGLRRDIMRGLSPICGALLLPVFFVVAGLRVDLSQISLTGLGELALIILVAVAGKFVGAYTGARIQGVDPRQSAVLAVLMNTRGLTELVVLSVGLELGALGNDLYSMMVVMTLVTTAMAGPLLHMLWPRRRVEREQAGAVPAPASATEARR